MNITPHVAQNNTNCAGAIDRRTTQHRGYPISQRKRRRAEEPWLDEDHRHANRFSWLVVTGKGHEKLLSWLDIITFDRYGDRPLNSVYGDNQSGGALVADENSLHSV